MNTPKVLRTAEELHAFATEHNLSADWHDRGPQGSLVARVEGRQFDNSLAVGRWYSQPLNAYGKAYAEMHVIFSRVAEFTATLPGGRIVIRQFPAEDLAIVNFATLCSWAAKHGNNSNVASVAIKSAEASIRKLDADLRTVRDEASKNAKERDAARAALAIATGEQSPVKWRLESQPMAIGVGTSVINLPDRLQLVLHAADNIPVPHGSFASIVTMEGNRFESGAVRADLEWTLKLKSGITTTERKSFMINPSEGTYAVSWINVADPHLPWNTRKGAQRYGATARLTVMRVNKPNLTSYA